MTGGLFGWNSSFKKCWFTGYFTNDEEAFICKFYSHSHECDTTATVSSSQILSFLIVMSLTAWTISRTLRSHSSTLPLIPTSFRLCEKKSSYAWKMTSGQRILCRVLWSCQEETQGGSDDERKGEKRMKMSDETRCEVRYKRVSTDLYRRGELDQDMYVRKR